jgi:pSer/pThr/pTyr-binding forkhead associated (FHA) protein
MEPTPGGRLIFPHDRVLVRVAVAPDARRSWKATLEGSSGIESAVHAMLKRSGCDASVALKVRYVGARADDWSHDWFHVEYHARPPEQTVAVPVPRVQLAVLKGVATRKRYNFQSTRINIGRSTEVLSAEQSAVARRNDVAFSDDKIDKASQTVSRVHAHISYRPLERAFWLHDDRSLKGTRIVRDGGELTLAKGSPRGEKLRTGDEIQVGDAALRFTILEETG